MKSSILVLCGFCVLPLTACQVVSVKQQQLYTALDNERDSILTRDKLSEASLNVLSMTKRQADVCTTNPQSCMDDLQQIPEIIDEQSLSTGSEIFLAHALDLQKSDKCAVPKIKSFTPEQQQHSQQLYQTCLSQQINALNQSIRFSYAYLFATKRPPAQRLFDNRQVQVRDFYNQAVANLVNTYNQLKAITPTNSQTIEKNPQQSESITPKINDKATVAVAAAEHNHQINQTDLSQILNIGDSNYHINMAQYPTLNPNALDKIISTYNLRFSGLTSVSRRDGFGSEFSLQLKTTDKKPFDHYRADPFLQLNSIFDHPNIHEAKYLPATVVVEPQQQDSAKAMLDSHEMKLRVIDPNLFQEIDIQQYKFPLAANFSAPYGLWLANDNFSASAYRSLIDRDKSLVMPHLYMLEPYNPKKHVIVMIHGLASSPETWITMTNDMMGDPILRDHYQVWQVFYSTNMPIIESRYQIYALLKQAFDGIAKQSGQPIQHAVLIGHSMGGVISRMLLSNDNLQQAAQDELQKKYHYRYQRFHDLKIAQTRLTLNALAPPIDRAIFISAPFQGTDFADRWFTRAARQIIRLPQSFLSSIVNTLSNTNNQPVDPEIKQMVNRVFQNGPSDLSQQSLFNQITAHTSIVPAVQYHIIVGNDTKFDDTAQMSDGIVPYRSAHLEGAASEKIIKGGHSIQETPEAVLELRRILRLHLQELGEYQPPVTE